MKIPVTASIRIIRFTICFSFSFESDSPPRVLADVRGGA